MTTNASETVSIMAIAGIMALSQITSTPTVSQYNRNNTTAYVQHVGNYYTSDTDVFFTRSYSSKKSKIIEETISLFDGEMRDFTPIELEQYKQSINKLYKPIGLNVFNL